MIALALLAAATLAPADLATVGARPAANVHLPDHLVLSTARGARTTLPMLAGGRPLLLAFVDYQCRHVCGPGLALAAGALARSGLAPGRDYRVALVGLDPRSPPAAMRALAAQGAPIAPAVAALRADPPTLAALSGRLGFRYARDAGGQFAHDAVLYAFAGNGRLVAVLPELGVTPAALRAALAGTPPVPTAAGPIARLCYGLAAAHGRFARPALIGMQAIAAAMLLGIGLFLLRRRAAA